MVEALAADGITEPFPVQAITLPDALAGKDLCGRAPTGSGKTLGFGIPMMTRISQAEPNRPTGLVLVPTRELAEQVQKVFVALGRAQWRFVQAIYGGASFGPQIHSLRKGASVVVATPGRLIDIIEKGHCDLSAVEVCVIDEADRMADLGFMPDLRTILDMTPTSRQTMLWSATLDGDVKELIRDYMKDPVRHDLLEDVESAPVDHKFVVTRPTERLDAAVALIEEHGPTVVFVKTRFGVDDVTDDLNRAGVSAGALHGARSQAIRQRTLDDFKRGKLQALVATDVAARGIHVDNVSLVLHYDLPDNDKDYTHRSGRTGRAGNAGVVIAFVPPSRQRIAQRMSDSINSEVIWEQGEKPVQRVADEDRATGNRDRDRPAYGDRDNGRPSYGSRSNYGGRDRGGDRNDRPAFGGDRPSYGGDRGSFGGRDRNDRASSDRGRSDRGGSDRGNYQSRPRPDANDWSPRPKRDDVPAARGEWTPRARRDDAPAASSSPAANSWGAPQTPRLDGPSTDRPFTPRARRDDDRTNERGRVDRDDRPRFSPSRDDSRRGPSSRPDGDRPPFARDGQRPPFGRDRNDRPAYGGDRPRDDRPRGDRPSYGDKPRGDRPAYGAERPAYGAGRPAYGAGRPSYGDKPRGDRSSFGGDRPAYSGDRSAPSSDRPWKDRADSRPPRDGGDRPGFAKREGFVPPRGASTGAPRRPGGAGGAGAPRGASGYPRPGAPRGPKRRPS